MKLSKGITGVAGEYLVAGELSRRGYIASITLRNTKGIDILASTEDGSKTVAIQVKSSLEKEKSWRLNKKAEKEFNQNLFYIFVNLKDELERPDYHIVPSEHVAKTITFEHKKWLSEPGRGGRERKDSDMRQFFDKSDEFLEKWDILDL